MPFNAVRGLKPTPEQVLSELRKILASKSFAQSERLRGLLTYVVEHTLQGDLEGLKESVLGREAMGRALDYDPKTDPIVRVYAQRLRARLKQYYEAEGVDDSLRISMPVGGYAPVFADAHPALPDVAPLAEPEISEPPAAPRIPHAWRFARIVALAIVIVAPVWYWLMTRPKAAPVVHIYDSIAVLPFLNMTGNTDFDYFEDGLTEEVINTLVQVKGLRVISRTSTFAFRGRERDIRTIARDLGVNTVLEGSVRKHGDGVRITAQLIDAANGSHLWSGEFDRTLSDTVLVQEDISEAILANLKTGAFLPAVLSPPKRHVPPADAYHAYLKGRYLWSHNAPGDYQKAIAQLQEAIALDPNYAQAYVFLALSYSGLINHAQARPLDTWPEMKSLAQKALELDDTLGEAHTTLAGGKANYDWDQRGADAEYRRGIDLAPGNAFAHQYYATFLGSLKRWKEADAQMAEATRLDPVSNLGIWGAAQLLYWEGRQEEAGGLISRLMATEPDYAGAYDLLAQIYFQQGRASEALAMMEKAPESVRKQARWIGHAGFLYAVNGEASKARECVARLEKMARGQVVSPFLTGLIYEGLGDKDRAIQFIGAAVEERLLRPGWLAADPMFKPLRSDPRFRALVKKVGLE